MLFELDATIIDVVLHCVDVPKKIATILQGHLMGLVVN